MSERWEPFDIALIGTSLTSYIGGWEKSARVALQASSARPIRTYNFGVPGATTASGLAVIQPPARLRPDVALIEYGMNDAQTAAGISWETFFNNLASILDTYATWSLGASQIFLMTMNPAVGDAAAAAPYLADYYEGVRQVATLKGVGLIDAYPVWVARSPTTTEIPDGVHPTPAEAVSVMVPLINAAVGPLIG